MLSCYPVQLVTFKYWKHKTQFLLNTDRYPTWTMFAVEQGSFAYEINDVSGIACQGEMVVCPADLDFKRQVIQPLDFYFIQFRLQDTESSAENNPICFLPDFPEYELSNTEYDRIASTFRQLRKFSREPNYSRCKPYMEHFVNDLWMVACIENQMTQSEHFNSKDNLMEKAKTLIDSSALDKVFLKDIASSLNISTVQLTRRFQAAFDICPIDYLTSLRIEKAKKLLVDTNYTLDHIAQLCGYDNGFYFSRVFSKHSKFSPSQYRKMYCV